MNAKLIEMNATKATNSRGPRLSCSPENFAMLIGPPSSFTERSPTMICLIPVAISTIALPDSRVASPTASIGPTDW